MNLQANFEVKRQGTPEKNSCQVYWLEESHLSQVEALQELILKSLMNKELFFPLTPTEFSNILTGKGGFALGAFVEGQLIGFGAMYFPRVQEDNLGRDVGLSVSELRQVAHLEVCFVHPDYRGNALQTKMGRFLIEQLSLFKACRHLFSTVMPANIPSIIDKFTHQMKIISLKQKYNNSWRYIFYRDLWVEEELEEQKSISVPSMDIPKQLKLLNQGYQGISYRKTEAGIEILYLQST